jgi:uncharacterized protein with von Willebrand factor type A (vWA) domain
MHFEYSRFEGDDEGFSPQSADELFDKLSEYMLQYGDEVLDNLQDWQEQQPDVVDMLIRQGLVEQDREGKFHVTPKGLKRVENRALDELFQVRRKESFGKHQVEFRGPGEVLQDESKAYEFGDTISNLNLHETMRSAMSRQAREGTVAAEGASIKEEDLVLYDQQFQTNCATVLLVDMSGSMTRMGKYGSAKRVAMALQSLINGRYQGDFLQIVGFYTYASPLTSKELFASAPKPVSMYDPRIRLRINLDSPPAFVPQHFTNIHAGLQFARRILHKQPTKNRQILVVTDGEPTAHVEGRDLMLIYPPSEQTALATLAEAKRCAAEGITISSFALIEDYFYLELVNFVQRMAEVTGGISAYCNAGDLGNLVIESFIKGRKKRQAR